ncbi:MAG: hypothetical protein NZ839_04480, partial [Endomicrobia bacterium]|nr:hypothetical protein [Endomicrobiia bacterium]
MNLVIIKLFLLIFYSKLLSSSYQDFYSGYNNPLFSPQNSQLILFTGDNFDKVYLYSLPSKEMIEISGGKSSGYKYYWSLDGKYIGFKHLIEVKENDEFLQLPVIYDVKEQQYIPLTEPQPFCGIPNFSADGKIVFSVGNRIRVLDKTLKLINEIEINNYSNITPISPDGKYIAYNDDEEQIWIVELTTNFRYKISDNKEAYYNPIWSPDSKKIIINTISGHIKVYDMNTRQIYYIDKGLSPQWEDTSEYVFYHKIEISGEGSGGGFKVIKSVICVSRFNGTDKIELTSEKDGFVGNCAVRISEGKILYKNFLENKFYFSPLVKRKTSAVLGIIPKTKIEI